MKRRAAVLLVAAAVLASGTAAGVARGAVRAKKAEVVKIQLMEWMVMPSTMSVRAGKVTFVVKDTGKLKHNFVVLKTNTAPNKLMIMGGKAMQTGLVGKTSTLKPGQTRRLTLTLKRGRYVLICNLPGHYKAGMRIAFRVR